MNMLSHIIHIPGFTVSDIEINETDTSLCPQCGRPSHHLRQSRVEGAKKYAQTRVTRRRQRVPLSSLNKQRRCSQDTNIFAGGEYEFECLFQKN